MKKAFFVFLISLSLIIPIRIWEYKNIIDHITGFYNTKHESTLVLLAILTISFILICIFTKSGRVMERPLQNGANALGISFILVGIAIEAIYLYTVIPYIREKTPFLSMKILLVVIGIITGAVFIIIGMKLLINKFRDTSMRVFMVVPIVWSISMLWRTFMGHQTIMSVSEHIFDIVSYILVTLSFLYLAYIVSGFGAIKHQKRMVIFGLTGSSLCLVNASSKLYNEVFIERAEYSLMELGHFLDLAVGLLLMVGCIYLCFGVDRNKAQVDEYEI